MAFKESSRNTIGSEEKRITRRRIPSPKESKRAEEIQQTRIREDMTGTDSKRRKTMKVISREETEI
jgi:hypothetical protein